jgi:diguanylate cyclase (GGDEF)-like protein
VRRARRTAAAGFLDGLRAGLLVAVGTLLVVLIALLDYQTGPYLSFNIFYLIPVAVCAWYGGFSHGILLAIAGAVAWDVVDQLENPFIPSTAALWNGVVRFGTLALVSSLVARLHTGVLRERQLARTDSLTGAANGRTFYEVAAAEVQLARRTTRPLTLAYFDLDNFKQLNDRLGHAVGDAALRHVVQTIQQHLRATDLLARLGGDEFALLLPETGTDGAVTLISRLQHVLAEEMTSQRWPVTLSVGAVTFLRPVWDVDRMIRRVDALMYGAKRQGKGRLEYSVIHDGEAPAELGPPMERRATARLLCDRVARIRREGEAGHEEEFATLRDLSEDGLGLHLERQFAIDTVLIIEPLLPETKTLLARVVRVEREGDGWVHGCVLSTRLRAEDLRALLGQLQESAV